MGIDSFEVTNDVVVKVIGGLYKLQKMILNPKKVQTMFIKMRDWFNDFTGDEDEAAGQFLIGKLVEAMEKNSRNQNLTETNVLMMRYGFHQAKDKNGNELFDLFELIMITFVLVERDGFHQLENDKIFTKKILQEVAAMDDEDELNEVVAEAIDRLEIRVHLATLILKEERAHQEEGKPFDITVDETW